MRVAFIDTDGTLEGSAASVLVRGQLCPSSIDSGGGGESYKFQEVYRVRLPRNPFTGRSVVIGEGKPENQNHAVIFAFGEAIQAIDMNQDGCLAEAFKMRNLLAVRLFCGCGLRASGDTHLGASSGQFEPMLKNHLDHASPPLPGLGASLPGSAQIRLGS